MRAHEYGGGTPRGCCPDSRPELIDSRIAEQAKMGMDILDALERAIEQYGYRVAKR